MPAIIVPTESLQNHLAGMLHAEHVKVRETKYGIQIVPVPRHKDFPLFGILSDMDYSTEQFIAEKQQEKALEL
ncbi:MAG: hypothetical protein FWG12_03715 [Holophagaceae bacterium]|nr:hypothetical protein [Holophagaceae bacterium]